MADDTSIDRLTSGVSGLDRVLHGGFPRGGITIFQGAPGAGKTILGNQICFHHVAGGGTALYVTLLAENHARMLTHMRQFAFFDGAAIPERLYYISAFPVLEADGLPGLLALLRKEAVRRQATVLVLDGLVAVEETAATPREFKKFIHELQALASLVDCTMFLLTGAARQPISAEHTMVDGIVELDSQLHGHRAERSLLVHKMRGTGAIRGRHAMRIQSDGIHLYPRIEAVLATPTVQDQVDGPTVPSGIPILDGMLGSGLPCHSTTLLVGPPGSGKTTLGLQFLSRCGPDEPGLFFGFYETPAALAVKARALELATADLMARGDIAVLWQPTTEGVLDEVCHRMFDAVRARNVRRIFIDGMDGFAKLATMRERLDRIFAAFTNELRARGVTAIYTAESESIGSVGGLPLSGLPIQGASALAENIVVLRYVELRSQLHRVISVLKVRDAPIDSSLRRFEIGAGGLLIDDSPGAAEAILAEAIGFQNPGRRQVGRTARSRER